MDRPGLLAPVEEPIADPEPRVVVAIRAAMEGLAWFR
jgi:hypothetical protein